MRLIVRTAIAKQEPDSCGPRSSQLRSHGSDRKSFTKISEVGTKIVWNEIGAEFNGVVSMESGSDCQTLVPGRMPETKPIKKIRSLAGSHRMIGCSCATRGLSSGLRCPNKNRTVVDLLSEGRSLKACTALRRAYALFPRVFD